MIDKIKLVNEIKANVKLLQDSLLNVTEVFMTDEQYNNDEDYDFLYELPKVYEVSKYGYHIYYSILSLDKGVVKAGGIGEDFGDVRTFDIGELQIDELIEICEFLG